MELTIVNNNGQVVVSSRQVAENFGKLHKDVLESIRDILVAENSAASFFIESTYENRGKQYPEYIMNRDGFALLAMGFTGSDAMQWKIKYIQAFNEMEQRSNKPMCMEDMMIAQLQSMKEIRLQIEQTTVGLIMHDNRLSQLEEIQSHKAEIAKELPPVNQMGQRSQLNQIIRGYSDRNNIPHSNTWHKLYEQFLYRYSINIKVRSGNRKQKPLDYCQHNGYLTDLLSLSIELYC